MPSDPILKIDNVSKEYPLYHTRKELLLNLLFPYHGKRNSFMALKPLSLEIYRGECVGIMGVNGSGKSTLLQMIAGTIFPTQGEIWADGKIASLLELGSWINATDTGRENIYTAGFSRGLKRSDIDKQLDGIIEFAEIGDFIDQPVSTYSTGMVMRLAFATCIYLNADILLLDEIFAVGDARFSQKCINFLRSYIQDKTVLLVSHDTNIISMLCSRVILLDHGALIADGSPRSVTEQYLEMCYGEKQSVTVQNAQQAPIPEDIRPAATPIELPDFTRGGRSFGKGGADILDVCICAPAGEKLTTVQGGQRIELAVRAKALSDLRNPAVGFVVRSPKGEAIWGDSSQPEAFSELAAGKCMEVRFRFVLPRLENGIYSIGVAVSTGALSEHCIQIWNHNALTFAVQSDYPLLGAMIGLPMEAILCKEIPEEMNQHEEENK